MPLSLLPNFGIAEALPCIKVLMFMSKTMSDIRKKHTIFCMILFNRDIWVKVPKNWPPPDRLSNCRHFLEHAAAIIIKMSIFTTFLMNEKSINVLQIPELVFLLWV